MAFAGLWEGFKWPDGAVHLNAHHHHHEANASMEELHDRMPVILEPEDWSAWLGEVEAILIRCFSRRMMMCGRFWPVSKQVNSPRNNGAKLLEAAE